MSVTVSQMKHKLRTLDSVREVLASTEPLATFQFTVGDQVRFRVDQGWQHGIDAKAGTDLVAAYISLGWGAGALEWQLTKDALLEATSAYGMSKTYAPRCPAELIEPHLNYWFRHGLAARRGVNRDFQLLVAAGVGAAVTRQSIVPFSNLRLLEKALDGIEARYGTGEVLADHKFVHSLRRTHLRLIVPAHTRTMVGTGTDDDTWSTGLQIKNSLIGTERTRIDGYLFRWICTNGATDARATSGAWHRQSTGGDGEVYEWARAAVDDVLGGLEPALNAVQLMADIPVEGQAHDVLRDVFEHYRVPVEERAKIIQILEMTGGELTMYSIMAAITQAANDPQMEPTHVDTLLRLGGDLPHAEGSRCEACRRIAH